MAGKGRPPTTANFYKNRTIERMRKLGNYKPEYDDLIDVYSSLLLDYHSLRKEFERSGRRTHETTANGNPKKSATVSTLENIRKDILNYSDRLLLNPKSNQTQIEDNQIKTKLDKLFDE